MGKELESVKLDKEIVDRVRKNKVRTGVSLARFIEDAILDKLNKVEQMIKGV